MDATYHTQIFDINQIVLNTQVHCYAPDGQTKTFTNSAGLTTNERSLPNVFKDLTRLQQAEEQATYQQRGINFGAQIKLRSLEMAIP